MNTQNENIKIDESSSNDVTTAADLTEVAMDTGDRASDDDDGKGNVIKMYRDRDKIHAGDKYQKDTFVYHPEYTVEMCKIENPFGKADSSRKKMIFKVFLIVLVSQIITATVTIIVRMPSVAIMLLTHKVGLVFGGIALIGLTFAGLLGCIASCYAYCRRGVCAIILHCIVVILVTISIAALTLLFESHIIVIALVATVVVIIVCFVLAMLDYDFTKCFSICILYLIIILFQIVLSAVLLLLVYLNKIKLGVSQMLSGIAGAAIYALGLIVELQMLFGDKSSEFAEEEYFNAATNLYYSSVMLFVKLLKAIAEGDD